MSNSVPIYGGMFDSDSVVETVGGFPVGNKAVDSAFFAKLISCFYSDGVIGDSFMIEPAGGLSITTDGGIGWIRGYMAWQKTAVTLTLNPGASYKIVLRLNSAAGEFTLRAITGDAENTANIKDLILAEVSVPSGTSVISSANITDTRGDAAKCGVVTSVLDALGTVALAQNAVMLGGSPASDFARISGCEMSGQLRAASEATGISVVRNISYGTSVPQNLANGELFILLSGE